MPHVAPNRHARLDVRHQRHTSLPSWMRFAGQRPAVAFIGSVRFEPSDSRRATLPPRPLGYDHPASSPTRHASTFSAPIRAPGRSGRRCPPAASSLPIGSSAGLSAVPQPCHCSALGRGGSEPLAVEVACLTHDAVILAAQRVRLAVTGLLCCGATRLLDLPDVRWDSIPCPPPATLESHCFQ